MNVISGKCQQMIFALNDGLECGEIMNIDIHRLSSLMPLPSVLYAHPGQVCNNLSSLTVASRECFILLGI